MSISSTDVSNENYKVIGYNSSFLSFSIVIISIISAIVKFNNTNITSLDIFDANYILLVTSLFLTSVDLFRSYKGYNKNALAFAMRFFAVISICLSGFILLLKGLTWLDICCIVSETKLAFSGNLADIHTILNIGTFKLSNCLYCYLFSALSQGIANLIKQFVDRQIRPKNN